MVLENTEKNLNQSEVVNEATAVREEIPQEESTSKIFDPENMEVSVKDQEKIEADLAQEEKLIEETEGITDEEIEAAQKTEVTRKARDWSEAGFVDPKAVVDEATKNRDFQRIRQLIRTKEVVELVQIGYEERGKFPHVNSDLLATFSYGKSAFKVKIPLQWFFEEQGIHTEPVRRGNNPAAQPRDPYFANRHKLQRFENAKIKMIFKQIVPKDDTKPITPDNIDCVWASRIEANQRLIDHYFFNPDIEPPQAGDFATADIVAVATAVCHVNIFGVDVTIGRGQMDYQYVADQRMYFHTGEKIHVKLTEVRINEETHTVRIRASRRESPQIKDKTTESVEEGYIKPGMRISGIVTHLPSPTTNDNSENSIIVGFHRQDASNNGVYDPNPENWYGDARVFYGYEIKRPVIGDLVCVNITNISERIDQETGEKSCLVFGRLVTRSFLNLLN